MLKTSLGRVGALVARAADFATRFHNDTRANVVAVVALSLVPLIGALALGSEAASWNVTNRGMQNAADSAVVAAATAGYTGNTAYAAEGYTVAARYGFTGSDHTSDCTTLSADCVSVLNGQTCPDATTGCYKVTINQPQALLLTQVLSLIGWNGDTTVGATTNRAVAISATALAEISKTFGPVCLVALKTGGGNAIDLNGVPFGNLGGCTILSNSSIKCTGGGAMGAGLVAYVSSASGQCVNSIDPVSLAAITIQNVQVPVLADPYTAMLSAAGLTTTPTASATLPSGCAALTAVQAANLTTAILASKTVGGNTCVSYTGNVNLSPDPSGNVTTPASGPTQIYINNGNLTGAATLVSGGTAPVGGSPTGGATVVFTGTTGGGLSQSTNLNLSSSSSGVWKGFTIVDPVATSISYSGNTPAWALSGIAYFPNAAMNFSGVPNKAGNGYNCFILISYTVVFNGTAQLYANPTSQCSAQGSTTPQTLIGFRTPLVS